MMKVTYRSLAVVVPLLTVLYTNLWAAQLPKILIKQSSSSETSSSTGAVMGSGISVGGVGVGGGSAPKQVNSSSPREGLPAAAGSQSFRSQEQQQSVQQQQQIQNQQPRQEQPVVWQQPTGSSNIATQNQQQLNEAVRNCQAGKRFTGKCNDIAGEFGSRVKGIISWASPASVGCFSYNDNDINWVPKMLDDDMPMACPLTNMDDEGPTIFPPIKPETAKISCDYDGKTFYAAYKKALPEDDAIWGNANMALRAYVDGKDMWCDCGWGYPHFYRGPLGGFMGTKSSCFIGNSGAPGSYTVSARMDGICWNFATNEYCGNATAPANAYIIVLSASKANPAVEDVNNLAYGCSDLVVLPK
jgi:hypothetical protein